MRSECQSHIELGISLVELVVVSSVVGEGAAGDVQVRITCRSDVTRCKVVSLYQVEVDHCLSLSHQLLFDSFFDLNLCQELNEPIEVISYVRSILAVFAEDIVKNVGEDVLGLEMFKHVELELKWLILLAL